LEFEARFVHRKKLENQDPSSYEIGNEGQKTTGKPEAILPIQVPGQIDGGFGAAMARARSLRIRRLHFVLARF
jgi:hypothetical protein